MLNPRRVEETSHSDLRSLQIGEEDRIQGRWKLLLLKDELEKGGEDGGRKGVQTAMGVGRRSGGGDGGGRVAHLGPCLEFSTPAASSGLVLRLSQITGFPVAYCLPRSSSIIL